MTAKTPKPLTAEVSDGQELFSISAVADATGVPPVTLRAWERRYGFLQPHRTAKGHRLYSMEHVALIRRVTALLESGMQVGRVGDLLLHEQQRQGDDAAPGWEDFRERMAEAILDFDEPRLDRLYNQALSIYPISLVTTELIVPMLRRVGECWERGISGVAEEHFFSLYLRNKLGSRWHHGTAPALGKRIVAACIQGERHENGLLLFALVARSRGMDPVLLGGDMPLAELPHVANKTGSAAVVLSCTMKPTAAFVDGDLRRLATSLVCPVFVGGAGTFGCDGMLASAGVVPVGQDIVAGVESVYRQLHVDNRSVEVAP